MGLTNSLPILQLSIAVLLIVYICMHRAISAYALHVHHVTTAQDLARALEVDNGKFAINIDTNFAFSDGLAAGEYEAMTEGLGPALMARAVRVPLLGMRVVPMNRSSIYFTNDMVLSLFVMVIVRKLSCWHNTVFLYVADHRHSLCGANGYRSNN